MADRLKKPNHRLAALIAESGLSNKGVARRVVQLGEVRGHPGLQYNHSSVDRWLRGERPRAYAVSLLAEIFSAKLGRQITPAAMGMAGDQLPMRASLCMPPTETEAARLVRDLARGDLDQRHPLISAQFDLVAYSSAALRWLVAPRTMMPPARGTRSIGMADVHEIRESITAFRMLDNRLGGGRIRPVVVEYLYSDIAPLLKDCRCTEDVRQDLFSAAAELAQLCGWQALDLELHGLSQRYLVQALTMARFAQDEELGGEILAAMSQQAVYIAHPDQAIDMAQAAQAAGRRSGMALLETESIVVEAHGHALRKDAGACSRALSRAETAFRRAARDERPPPAWLTYFDEAYFAAKIAHCFRALGQGRETEKYALRSLKMDRRYVRGQAFNTALLATGYALQDELEQACTCGTDAVDLAATLESVRAATYIRQLLHELRPHQDQPRVRDLRSHAESKLPALRRHASPR